MARFVLKVFKFDACFQLTMRFNLQTLPSMFFTLQDLEYLIEVFTFPVWLKGHECGQK